MISGLAVADGLERLRAKAALVAASSSNDDILQQAQSMVSGLSEDEREEAALFYMVQLLRDQHRSKVSAVERIASAPRTKAKMSPQTREALEQELAGRQARLLGEMVNIVSKYEQEVKMQWTAELLSSTFALPDGRLVKWGDASINEHQARRDMLVGNARGNIEAATRHQAAIEALQKENASCLRDLA